MGYKGIYTEGVEKILGEKSPNYLYTPKGCKENSSITAQLQTN